MRPPVLVAASLTALAAAVTALAAAGPARATATDPPAPQGVFLTVSGDQGAWMRGELRGASRRRGDTTRTRPRRAAHSTGRTGIWTRSSRIRRCAPRSTPRSP